MDADDSKRLSGENVIMDTADGTKRFIRFEVKAKR